MSVDEGPADATRSPNGERLPEIRAAYAARLRAIADDLPPEMAALAADYRALANRVEAGDLENSSAKTGT